MPSKKNLILVTVALALFMDVLDTNILNTAIPTMARFFKVYPVDLKIALISYLLSLALFIPISGWVADKYGIKLVYISGLACFTVSSFWCGYAQSLLELVLGRSMQGLGGAFMFAMLSAGEHFISWKLSGAVGAALTFLIIDFLYYLQHRIFHTDTLFAPFHEVHHTS